jgi:branched-chain amino acid transport system substrate-binding protein
VFGFMAPFCKAGGHVVKKFWVPIGTKDFASVIAAMPDGIDAIYVVLGGSDSVNFLTQYKQAGGQAPLIGGSVTVDQTILGSKGKIHDVVIGTPSAGPIADDNSTPAWNKFVEAYKKIPNAFPSPSLFAHGYYVNAMALLTGLQKVNADVSDGGGKLRATLASLVLETPTGKVSLDQNRNAIADMFLTEVTQKADGTLYNKLIKTIPQVNQTLGIPEAEFLKLGKVGRDNPSCP